VYYLFVNITKFDLYSVILFCCFYGGNRGKPTGKIHFSCLRVRSASLAETRMRISTKTMAVRIFRSGKISNFGGIFFPIVHLFRLGSNDSDKVSFYLLIHAKSNFRNGIASFGCSSYGLTSCKRLELIALTRISSSLNLKALSHYCV
jgi:hypothetical protein